MGSKKSYLVDVLARELRDELLKTLILGLNADGAEDSLDILSRGGGVAAESEQEVSCEVLHFESFCRRKELLEIFEIFLGFPKAAGMWTAADSANSMEQTVISDIKFDSIDAAMKREATHFRRFKRNTRNQSL